MSDYLRKKLAALDRKTGKSSSYWNKNISAAKRSKKDDEDEDDIAPIRSTKQEDDGGLNFFQKSSLFDDGWQFGDVTKTVLGSAGDAGLNIVKGAGGLVEGVTDLLGYGVAGVAGVLGQDEVADRVKTSARENTLDRILAPAEGYLDDYSVFGKTSDAILQGVGQVAGIMATGGAGAAAGFGTAGVTALTSGVMGLSGMGSGMGEAYEGGATDGEAVLYGAISGASDAITEMIFGGLGKAVNAVGLSRGLSSLDDLAAKKVSSMFSSQIMKNLSQLGVKATAEGVEEVLAGIAQAAGKKATYMSEKEFSEILKDENLLEQFVVGAVTSGISQAPSFIGSTVKGRDFISGLDQNEQAVVNKEVENRIAEAEKDGKKLTKKEKGEIDEQVRRDLERGYLSTDLIEETIAGDLYAKYKHDAEWESSLRKEYDELYNMKSGEKSSKQGDREAELKKYFESIKGKDSKALKGQITSKVSERVKGSRLAESYREVERGREKFTAELSKYDEKQRAVVQKAIDSGILNNTNRSHDFVDFVAKISADTNTPFEFSNNEKLNASGFALADGKMPNGIKTKDGIVLNMSSNESRRFVVGHEITHVLEGTDLYTELQTAVFDYAKTKGEYDTRLKAITDLYEKYDPDADPLQELTADLVGDYIFSDQDFVNNLSAKNQNVFQKIYSEIKHLLKLATAGSKEARMLENAKRAFEKAYREGGKSQEETRYSISETSDGRFVAVVDDDILSHIDTSNWNNETKAEAKKAANKVLKNFREGFKVNGIEYVGNKKSRGEYIRSNYSEALSKKNPEAYLDKMRAASVLDDVIRVAADWTNDGYLKHDRLDFVDFIRGKTLIKSGDRTYSAVVIAGVKDDGQALFYDVEDISPDSFEIKESEPSTAVATNKSPNAILESSDIDNVAQAENVVKHSLSDSDGNRLTREQQEYFQDSKVRDGNGSLLVMYHGTPNGDFTVFRDGTYFTADKEYADRYQNPGASSISTGKVASAPKTFEVYLNIKKPFDIADAEAKSIYINDYIKGGNAVGINPYLSDAEYAKINAIDWTEGEDLREFLIENEYDYDGLVLDEGGTGGYGNEVQSRGKSYVVFSPEQVKNTDNKKPTVDPDIRRSLTEGNRTAPDPLSALQLQDDIAPPVPGTAPAATVAENANVQAEAPMQEEDPITPVEATTEVTTAEESSVAEEERPIKTVKERLTAQLEGRQTELENIKKLRDETIRSYDEKIAAAQASLDRKKNKETKVANALKKRIERLKRLKADIVAGYSKRISDIESGVDKISAELEKDHTERDRYEEAIARINATLESDKAALTAEYAARKAEQQALIEDKNTFVSRMAKELYDEISSLRKGVRASKNLASLLDAGYEWKSLKSAMAFLRYHPGETVENGSAADSAVRQLIEDAYEETAYGLDDLDVELAEKIQELENKAEAERRSARSSAQRKLVPERIMNYIKEKFAEKGFDLDEVLRKAKNLSTWRTVDNTPQRVMEKALGYKEGGILADITVNKVAQNETEGIRWLNSFTDRKNGLLAQISKQYDIKPGSDESAAAQMYAEGFYVNAANEIVEYGDVELAKDFPDIVKRSQIKGLARDPRIRKIYDETLDAVNESRARNGYPEIQRINNYFLHFRAMNDTFSKLGLPFNPNDIRAKDLPTDLNGATADLKPGQPYFASARHRIGKRTSFDLLGGLEQYLTSAKNQIYHIDDIQNLRALRNYIADMYGQAVGLEDLNVLSEEEQQERIKQVYGSHLSTFAKFLNEEANILAGKTSLIDRGLEGIVGRRGMTVLNNINGQVGANMVGYNVSSALTNFLAPIQAMAKTDPRATIAGYAQFISNKLKSINGKGDGFAEQSPVMIRRKGAERFNRTLWQRLSDPGYALMSAVDDISTELIARSKYNEFVQKGMDPQQAHIETDKWVSRLMGDRSLGQQPHLFNSKTLGILTKFQLEVRNQLDSQFYDTIREAQASYEDIEDGLMRNAKIAAKVGATFFALAVGQHLFGKAFEAVAGYNPAFDVISAIIKTFGWDDDDESEDAVLDNIEQGFFELMDDMPYVSTLTGGRVPMASALPIKELYSGEDQYGNEKSRWKTLGEALPYYLLPGGYGQIKKTAAGLSMFWDEHPIAGSYTQSGNLRFPVEDNLVNRAQAGVFGQYASRNARDYFDDELAPLEEKQTQEYADSGMTIQEYRKYREGLKKYDKQADKARYINRLDLSDAQKEVLKSYLYNEEKYKEENPEKYEFLENEGIGYLGYKELDEDAQSAWSWAFNHQDEYQYYKANGVMPGDYTTYYIPMLDFENESNKAYQWAFEYPDKAPFGRVFGEGVTEYRQYANELSELKADKDENGKSISGSRKQKVLAYINSLDIDYGAKLILFKDTYNSDNDSNYQILEYLNSREDISFEEKLAILRELDFTVTDDGNVYWD